MPKLLSSVLMTISIFTSANQLVFSQQYDPFNQNNNGWTNSNSNNYPNNSNGNHATNIQNQVNQQAMQMMGYSQPITPPSDPYQAHLFITNNAGLKTRKELQQEYLKSILKEDLKPYKEFDNSHYQKEAQIYLNAFDKLKQMVATDSFTISQAVFITENVYFNNEMSYKDFTERLDSEISWIKLIVKREKLDTSSHLAKNYALQKLFSSKIYKYTSNGEVSKTHYPFKYDFDDFKGDVDWSKMFVSKLLKTTKGQCHSMPLLYLCLAERSNTKAFLSLAAEHSFIKFQDDFGNWYNFETTNGYNVSDDWLVSSGFVTSQAIKSLTYLDTLGKNEIRAQIIVDLALGYERKFGYDNFLGEVVQFILTLDSDNLQARILNANMLTLITRQELKKIGDPPIEKIQDYPQANECYTKMIEAYDFIDALGYQPMPEELYQQWLRSIEEEKNKTEGQIINDQIKKNAQTKN